MRTRTMMFFLVAIVFAPALWVVPALAQGGNKELSLVSSNVCKDCHADIHRYWQNSMHAYSYSDPIFHTAYNKAVQLSEESKELCLRCHAPATLVNHDYDVERDITKEGVTCDFCHTVEAISRQSDNFAYEFNYERRQMGPIKDANSPIHESAYSALHTTSEFCAGCHEFSNAFGVKLLATYTEWKDSPFAAEGVQCQHCHMPMTEGFVVEPDIKKTTNGVNLHNLQGGHSVDKIKSAASVKIGDIQKFSGSVRVQVDVANKGSGHRIPTGTPSRELLLEVALLSVPENRLVEKKQVSYKKTLIGENGQVLEGDAQIMVNARKVLSDNRIAPRETRTTSVMFLNMPASPYTVRAKLYYNYLAETAPGQMQQMLIELAGDEKALLIE